MRAALLTRIVLLVAGLSVGRVVVADEAEQKAAVEAPRYKVQVGQEVTYRSSLEMKQSSEKSQTVNNTWNLVVADERDGKWRLIGRHTLSVPPTKSESNASSAQAKPYERTTLICFDLSNDGRIALQGATTLGIDPYEVFPRLPDSVESARQGWTWYDEASDSRHRYRLAGSAEPNSGKWFFLESRTSPMDEVYGRVRGSEFRFNPERGLVDRIETQDSQSYGIVQKGSGVTQLASSGTIKAPWMDNLSADYDRYAKAVEQSSRFKGRAMKDPNKTARMWALAGSALKVARRDVQAPMIQEQLDKEIADHSKLESYVQDQAKRYAELVQQPAIAWETTDLDGKKHGLEQYRGRVVLLDFWYRGCGWCVRAMPQIKEVAAHFRQQPVTVLGMNVDQNEQDARFVIERLKLNYPNLRAESISSKYKVQGYPTLILIDQHGRVRDVHVGYTPKLKEELITSVDKLLRSPGGSTFNTNVVGTSRTAPRPYTKVYSGESNWVEDSVNSKTNGAATANETPAPAPQAPRPFQPPAPNRSQPAEIALGGGAEAALRAKIRNLVAAANHLQAAGLADKAAELRRQAGELAQELNRVKLVTTERTEPAEVTAEVRRLRQEVQGLRAAVEQLVRQSSAGNQEDLDRAARHINQLHHGADRLTLVTMYKLSEVTDGQQEEVLFGPFTKNSQGEYEQRAICRTTYTTPGQPPQIRIDDAISKLTMLNGKVVASATFTSRGGGSTQYGPWDVVLIPGGYAFRDPNPRPNAAKSMEYYATPDGKLAVIRRWAGMPYADVWTEVPAPGPWLEAALAPKSTAGVAPATEASSAEFFEPEPLPEEPTGAKNGPTVSPYLQLLRKQPTSPALPASPQPAVEERKEVVPAPDGGTP